MYTYTSSMKYFEDEEFIEKQLYDADVQEIDKFIKNYFKVRRQQK